VRVTKNTHACIRFEGAAAGGVLVVDPGAFGERDALDGADAVLITHEHADHLDVALLREHLEKHPETVVFAHPDVAPKIEGGGVTAVTPGDHISAAGFSVTVPAAVTAAGCASADQVSGLPPLAASNSPTCVSVPVPPVKVKRMASVFCCAPVPVKVTRCRA
jgi:L-ascorbate metabolism protein UlaG (beta-lactamase superfamily)